MYIWYMICIHAHILKHWHIRTQTQCISHIMYSYVYVICISLICALSLSLCLKLQLVYDIENLSSSEKCRSHLWPRRFSRPLVCPVREMVTMQRNIVLYWAGRTVGGAFKAVLFFSSSWQFSFQLCAVSPSWTPLRTRSVPWRRSAWLSMA